MKQKWCDLKKYIYIYTVFPRIVFRGNYSFLKCKMWKFSYSFPIMAIFYFVNWIVATETIKGGKLFKGGNYSRIYGMYIYIFIPNIFLTNLKMNKRQRVYTIKKTKRKLKFCNCFVKLLMKPTTLRNLHIGIWLEKTSSWLPSRIKIKYNFIKNLTPQCGNV